MFKKYRFDILGRKPEHEYINLFDLIKSITRKPFFISEYQK